MRATTAIARCSRPISNATRSSTTTPLIANRCHLIAAHGTPLGQDLADGLAGDQRFELRPALRDVVELPFLEQRVSLLCLGINLFLGGCFLDERR